MDPVIIGILICVGFMGFILTMIWSITKARKNRRLQQDYEEDQDPDQPE